ncbi:MAG: choice-of-anchor J domain-containing protein [Muribaculaceae bacterium]
MKLQHLTQSLSTAVLGITLLTALSPASQAATSAPSTAYGVLVSAASWTDTPAFGVYSFKVSGTDNTLTAIMTGEDYGATFGAVYGNNKLLCTKPGMILGGSPIEMDYKIFDGKSYAAIDSRYGDPYRTLLASTYDTATGQTYVLLKDRYDDTYYFGTMDTSSGFLTQIFSAKADKMTGWHSLASTPEGRLYAIDNNGVLLSVDKKTGTTTEIASTGLHSELTTSGEIDPETGRYMFIACNATKSTLYSIDLATAKAEKVYDFGDGEQIFAMHFQQPAITDTKPSPVRSFNVVFDGESLEGTVKFNAPVTDDNWEQGSGPLTYYVYVDGVEIAKGETSYAASGISVPVSVAAPGLYEFSAKVVTPGNAVSEISKKEIWVGKDIPGNVTNFKAAYDGTTFALTWDAPTGMHGGWFDASQLTYTITMQPGGEVIANAVSGTSFSYPYAKPSELTTVSFEITPASEGSTFEPVSSNPLVIGDAPEPPFEENFDNGEAKGFTVIDGNNDGVCFVFENGAAKLNFGHEGYNMIPSSDWLVLPPLKLKGGHAYYISFDAYGTYAMYDEKVAAYVGQSATPISFITGTEIIAPTRVECDATNPLKLGTYFTPATDGEYYIGIYGCSDADKYALNIDNVKVSAGVPASAPAAVTELTAIPGKNGQIALTLTYKAPTLNFVGGQLEKLTKVEIYRDDVLAGTQTPKMGETSEWADPEPSEGDHTYRLVPYNGDTPGDPSTIKTHIGIDKPMPTKSITFAYGRHKSEAVLTWEPVTTDINGGELTADQVTYKVYRVHNRDQVMLAEGLTECTYTDEFGNSFMPQTAAYYSVVATTKAGDGDPTNTEFCCLGRDYPLPFTESFANGQLAHAVWITGNESQNSAWNINEDTDQVYFTSQDKDNGYLYFYTYSGTDKGSFYSGRISLEDVPDAELRFYAVTPNPYAGSTITVRIDPGTGFEDVETFTLFADEGCNMQWKLFKVNLGKYAGKSIRLAFAVETVTPFVAIDNITIRGIWKDDLAVSSLSAPASARPGIPFEIAATIANEGSQAQTDYTVTLFRNGEAVATHPGTAIDPDKTSVVTFTETANSLWDNVTYHVSVDLASDAAMANNTSAEAIVAIRQHKVPSPTELEGILENNKAKLEWLIPDLESGKADIAVDGGMDEVSSFAIGLPHSQLGADDNVGDWMMVDVDGLPTLSDTNLEYPNKCKPAAFIAFDNNVIGWEMFEDNDGDGKSFIAWASVGGRNNDWLISPRLSGKAQTISFYAKSLMDSPESFEVLASSDMRDINAFSIIGERRTAQTGAWGKVEVEIPDGTLYFAIRYVSYDNFALLVDDFNFVAAGPTVGLELTGYNVYCNDAKVNTEAVATPLYNHSEATEGSSYRVTALYNNTIESAPSDVFVLQKSGLDGINGGLITITSTGTTLRIEGAEGEFISVATADGKTLFTTKCADATVTLDVPCGVLLVRAGSQTAKIFIR